MKSAETKSQVRLMTLDPGHFHAALVQKTMYEQISPVVSVYAPEGSDIEDHLNRIAGFNNRIENPTSWQENLYTGSDFLKKMITQKPGNVVVISGNNRKKAEYIKACIDAGLNVLADKPMCIDAQGFELIKQAYAVAEKKGLLLYDIMTERSEINTLIQKELMHNKAVFGQLQKGSVEEPAVVKESVHHFFKSVAGNPIKRPGWYFDTTQQGEGIVDVTTHLTDLIMWEAFPEQAIDYEKDIEVKKAKRWPTMISQKQYEKVTRLKEFPPFLQEKLNGDGILPCYANGEIIFTVKGIHSKAAVTWNFQAPEGTKDTHFSVVRGSKANIFIRQGKEQNYCPQLYVEPAAGTDKKELAKALVTAIANLQSVYPGISLDQNDDVWQVVIPDKYRIGHEAHFRQVVQRYLKYLEDGKLPNWELANIKAKYATTTNALELARAKPKIEFVKADKKIDVIIGGEYVTSYLFGNEPYDILPGAYKVDHGFLPKPVLYPVRTLSGIVVTRSYPLADIEGESRDHPHHVGIFFASDFVNEEGFWANTSKSTTRIQHVKVTQMAGGNGRGTLSTVMHWIGKDGKVLLEEKRDMTFIADENEYAIDFSIDLIAQDTKVVFHDNKEALLAIRVADWLREKGGNGRYYNSEGDETAENIWGRRAKWVTLQAQKDGNAVGIAIFDHPSSVNHPSFWHSRDYGMFCVDPIGQSVFQEILKVENPQPFNLTVEPGEAAHFEYRLLIYDGTRTKEQLDQQFSNFSR